MKINNKMILSIIAFAFVTELPASDINEDKNWSRTFVYQNGVSVVRTPECVILGGMLHLEKYTFSAGSSFNGLVALENGQISIKQSLMEFRQEAQKLGPLNYEK